VNNQQMSSALDAIHDEALRLMDTVDSISPALQTGLELIISLARHEHDVRSVEEIQNSSKT
jgi:hypothetical protein